MQNVPASNSHEAGPHGRADGGFYLSDGKRVGELIAEENYAHAHELIQVVRKTAKLKFARGYRTE
jgi:hypothetical protein